MWIMRGRGSTATDIPWTCSRGPLLRTPVIHLKPIQRPAPAVVSACARGGALEQSIALTGGQLQQRARRYHAQRAGRGRRSPPTHRGRSTAPARGQQPLGMRADRQLSKPDRPLMTVEVDGLLLPQAPRAERREQAAALRAVDDA